jgi:hypothetical protein
MLKFVKIQAKNKQTDVKKAAVAAFFIGETLTFSAYFLICFSTSRNIASI